MLIRPTFAEVDVPALKKNLQILKDLSPRAWFCPMLKANAYGHGALQVGKAVEQIGANAIGVASIEEGIQLREAGLKDLQILIFGFVSSQAIELYHKYQLVPVVGSKYDLQIVSEAKQKKLVVHLKFNTGMNRLGLPSEEAEHFATLSKKFSHLVVEGICSHLMKGEDFNDPQGLTRRQIEKFKAVVKHFPAPIVSHLYNSAAILEGAVSQEPFGVRPGVAVYGSGLTSEQQRTKLGIQPVMSLKSEIRLLHHLAAGECVSYGCQWRAPRPSVVAVVPIGYADGLSRRLTNNGFALVRGQRVPLVGTICMDYTMLDVTHLNSPEQPVKIGEKVTFWGKQGEAILTADEQALKAQTIAYELYTSVGSRVPRQYSGEA